MVQSSATTVAAYLKEVTPEQRVVLNKLRKLVKSVCIGAKETMQYGMPTYNVQGNLCLAFNAQKNYYALYAGIAALAKFKQELKEYNCGKSCWRFTDWNKIDISLMTRVIETAYTNSMTHEFCTPTNSKKTKKKS
jgi:uncharacterized protein YdhG (YjbR/CyaY superfamily)